MPQDSQGAQINFQESGRGLGHVTPTIFGNTVGYPSDSLASCYILFPALSVADRPPVCLQVRPVPAIYSK